MADKQGRLLWSAIGNFLGRKVTCPVISNISLTECPDEASTMPCANTYERLQALVTMPILPCGQKIVQLTMKHDCETAESDASGPSKKPKRCQVSLSTFTKWQAQLEREHQTMMWLHCDTDKASTMSSMRRGATRPERAKLR